MSTPAEIILKRKRSVISTSDSLISGCFVSSENSISNYVMTKNQWVGDWVLCTQYNSVKISTNSDQPGELQAQWSNDADTIQYRDYVNIQANIGDFSLLDVKNKYLRLKFVPTSTYSSNLSIYTVLTKQAVVPTFQFLCTYCQGQTTNTTPTQYSVFGNLITNFSLPGGFICHRYGYLTNLSACITKNFGDTYVFEFYKNYSPTGIKFTVTGYPGASNLVPNKTKLYVVPGDNITMGVYLTASAVSVVASQWQFFYYFTN